jgi:hypothetical protein
MAIICVKLENERHATLKQTGNLYVLERIFGEALKTGGFRWLEQIDPYGDTVLNRVQIASFLEEWQQLARYVQSDAETFALEEVRSLAEECAAQPHRYLRFFGD